MIVTVPLKGQSGPLKLCRCGHNAARATPHSVHPFRLSCARCSAFLGWLGKVDAARLGLLGHAGENPLVEAPICPICSRRAMASETRYGTRHSCCGLWSWDGAPLVDEATHEARKAAHAAFDAIWKEGHLPRREAYARLSKLLGIAPEKCHMKLMDAATASLVPGAVRRIMAGISQDDGVVIE